MHTEIKDQQSIIDKVKKYFFNSQYIEDRNLLESSFNADNYNEAFINTIISCPKSNGDVILGKDVLADIEMFCAYKEGDTNTVFNTLFQRHLKGTSLFLREVLSNPITSVNCLSDRQSIIRNVARDLTFINQKMMLISEVENDVLWLFENREENVSALYDIIYFQYWFLKKMNNVDVALTTRNLYRIVISPLIGIVSPIIYFVVPYMVLRYKIKIRISFTSYLKLLLDSSKFMFEMKGLSGKLRYCSYMFSLIFYFQGVFNSVEISKTLYNISDFIIKKTCNIASFINVSDEIISGWFVPETEKTFFGMSDISAYVKIRMPHNVRKDYWIMSNFGNLLSLFHSINKEEVASLLTRIYMIDAIVSVANAMNKYNLNYASFSEVAQWVEHITPTLMTNNLRHPCLANAIGNDMFLGKQNKYPKNMILTGPNAGGKSTFVKSILINVILCQTVGITNSDACKITPFKYINSQINIPDCKGKESLFQAEMNRCKTNFDQIKLLKNKELALIIMDEIFNSTNPVEGISGAYAVASKMTRNTNVMMIFTTHFTYLTNLAKHTGAFANYKMNVIATPTGQFLFPYKLIKGVSRQYIALELLELNGFDKDIIKEAKLIRDKICV